MISCGNCDNLEGKRTPVLPDKCAAKLRSNLDLHGTPAYLVPDMVGGGAITHGPGITTPSSEREAYAQPINDEQGGVEEKKDSSRLRKQVGRREEILDRADLAFPDKDSLVPVDGFSSDIGMIHEREVALKPSIIMAGTKKRKEKKKKKVDIAPEVQVVDIMDSEEVRIFYLMQINFNHIIVK